jgi:hypothetical protein
VSNTNENTPLSQDEEYVYNGFEKIISDYNAVIRDENKQKDFYNKISSLFPKLKNHELKINMIKLLIEFVDGKYNF